MSSVSSSSALAEAGAKPSPQRRSWFARTWPGIAGIVAVLALWWIVLTLAAGRDSLAAQFLPTRAIAALPSLINDDRLFEHIVTSLRRIAVGLAWAL